MIAAKLNPGEVGHRAEERVAGGGSGEGTQFGIVCRPAREGEREERKWENGVSGGGERERERCSFDSSHYYVHYGKCSDGRNGAGSEAEALN